MKPMTCIMCRAHVVCVDNRCGPCWRDLARTLVRELQETADCDPGGYTGIYAAHVLLRTGAGYAGVGR